MKIKVTKKGTFLIPAFEEDLENFRKMSNNEVYSFEFKKERNIKFHRKYFGLLNLAWENLPEWLDGRYKNIDHFRKAIQIRAGICEVIISLDGEEIVQPLSIAFDKLDENEFNEVYQSVLDILVNVVFKDSDQNMIDAIISQF